MGAKIRQEVQNPFQFAEQPKNLTDRSFNHSVPHPELPKFLQEKYSLWTNFVIQLGR